LLNSSALGAANVVILGDGSVIGSGVQTLGVGPFLQSLDGGFRASLGLDAFAGGAFVGALYACDASTVVALVQPVESGEGPPLYDWAYLVAVTIATPPPPQPLLWARNLSAGLRPSGPPGAIFAACASGTVVILTPVGDVLTIDLATGALRARAAAIAPATSAQCIVTPDARLLACLDGSPGAGGMVGVALAGVGGPAVAWTPAEMGWSLGGGGSPGGPVFDAPSGSVLVSSFSAIFAVSRDGALLWNASLPSGALISATLLSAVPRPPNAPQLAWFAANLATDVADLGCIWVLDVRTGARAAFGALPKGVQLTSALVVDGTGTNALVNGWDLNLGPDGATAVYMLHFSRLGGNLTIVGTSPWRAAPAESDIYPAFALGPSSEQVIVQAAGGLSIMQASRPRPLCAWSSALPGQYIAHCADDGCAPYATLADAKAACAAALSCGGLTSDPATGAWELRADGAAAPSPNGETAYLIKNAVACHAP